MSCSQTVCNRITAHSYILCPINTRTHKISKSIHTPCFSSHRTQRALLDPSNQRASLLTWRRPAALRWRCWPISSMMKMMEMMLKLYVSLWSSSINLVRFGHKNIPSIFWDLILSHRHVLLKTSSGFIHLWQMLNTVVNSGLWLSFDSTIITSACSSLARGDVTQAVCVTLLLMITWRMEVSLCSSCPQTFGRILQLAVFLRRAG